MNALPAEQKIGELRRRTRHHLAAQQRQTAALHLIQIRRRRPLHRLQFATLHRDNPPRTRPLLQLAPRPVLLERIAFQQFREADQRVRRQETLEDVRSRFKRFPPLPCSTGERGEGSERLLVERFVLGSDPAARFTTARQLNEQRTPLGSQFLQKRGHRSFKFRRRQIAQASQPFRHFGRGARRHPQSTQPFSPPDAPRADRASVPVSPATRVAATTADPAPPQRPRSGSTSS